MTVAGGAAGTAPPSATTTRGAAAVDIAVAGDDEDLNLTPVVRFLKNSLSMKAGGDGSHYHHLVAQLRSRDDRETLLKVYLGLGRCVEEICDRPDDYRELVDAIFRFDWDQPPEVARAYKQLVTQLVSANSTYLLPALHALVRSLVLEGKDLSGDGAGVAPSAHCRRKTVHETLQALMVLVPSGKAKLFPVLSSCFPHPRLSGHILADYARQLFLIAEYEPSAQAKIVQLIVERSLVIDVEIKIMDNGDAVREEDDEGDGDIFSMEDDHLQGSAKDSSSKEGKEDVNEMADKLDGLMLVLFSYVEQQLGQGEQSSKKLFSALLLAFEESILATHRCKYVQYVVFYACGIQASRAGEEPWMAIEFVQKLLDITLDQMKPPVIRQMSVAYLASYLARASYLDIKIVDAAVTRLLEHIISYYLESEERVSRMEGSSLTPLADWPRKELLVGNHSSDTPSILGTTIGASSTSSSLSLKLFYSFCQAAFYVMCFHGATLTHHAHNHAADWERILRCRLSPLRHCLDTVRREFARLCCAVLASHFPEALLDLLRKVGREDGGEERRQVRTARAAASSSSATTTQGTGTVAAAIVPGSAVGASIVMPTPPKVSMTGGLGKGSNPLDSFFPFDPYLLRRSHAHISSMYNYWHGGVQREDRQDENDDVDSSDLESEGDSEGEEHEYTNAFLEGEGADVDGDLAESTKLANSLMSDAMSFTPVGDNHLRRMMTSSKAVTSHTKRAGLLDTAGQAHDDFHQAISISPGDAEYHAMQLGVSVDAEASAESFADDGW